MGIFNRDYNFFRVDWWVGQIDSRPLSLFRILFALTLLKDALYHLPLAEMFYSENGIVTHAVVQANWRTLYRFSLMDAIDGAWLAQLFFLAGALIAVCLLLGYRTRLMTVLNFVYIVSVHERNPWVLNGADVLIRNLSFFMMFVPLAHHYSLDALRRRWQLAARTHQQSDLRPPSQPHTAFAFPVRMIQFQVAYVYLFTALLKFPGDRWREGEALHQALQSQGFTLPPGDWLLSGPVWLLEFLTYGALFAETAFVILVFFPLVQPGFRIIGLLLGVGLHVGIGVTMAVPNFSIVMLTTYVLFLEPRWIVWLFERLRPPSSPLLMPTPPEPSPLWLLAALTPAKALALVPDVAMNPRHHDEWWAATHDGTEHTGENAWRAAFAHLPLSRLWLWTLRYTWVRRLLWGAAERWVCGQPGVVGEPRTAAGPSRWQRDLAIAWKAALIITLTPLMIYLFQWNLHQLNINGQPVVPRVTGVPRHIILFTSMHQGWGMFAPYPPPRTGWVAIPGTFEDGIMFELLTGEADSTLEPSWRFGPFARMRKFHEVLRDNEGLLEPTARYFCQKHNILDALPEGQRLATLEIHYMWRYSVEYGEAPFDYRPEIRWRHWCYPEYQY